MKKLLIAAGVAGLLAATPVLAQDVTTAIPADKTQTPQAEKCFRGHHGKKFNHHKMNRHPDFKKFEEALDLTAEQKAKAEAIRQKEKEQIKPIVEKIKEKYGEQKEIMDKRLTAAERFNELMPIRKEIRDLNGEIHKIRKQSKAEFESILTKKQLKKLDKMKAQAKKDFKEAMKDRRHHVDWDRKRPAGPVWMQCPCPKPPVELPLEPPVEPPAPAEE